MKPPKIVIPVSREIKFRAWSEGKMIYPESPTKITYHDNRITFWKEINHVADLYAVVMQYTGLKDKNGKEIYEGDILNVKNGGEWEVWEVGFWRGTFSAKEKYYDFTNGEYLWDIHLASEVIGNIYETPELLK
jgi:uncharacterized phage protein (TIGR01671 family)